VNGIDSWVAGKITIPIFHIPVFHQYSIIYLELERA